MNSQSDNPAVTAAVQRLYQHFNLGMPEVMLLGSPAAAEYLFGLASGSIPGWFLARRLNPDLYMMDNDIPPTFWEGIKNVLGIIGAEGLRAKISWETWAGCDIINIFGESLGRITPDSVIASFSQANDTTLSSPHDNWRSLIPNSLELAFVSKDHSFNSADLKINNQRSEQDNVIVRDALWFIEDMSNSTTLFYPFQKLVLIVVPPVSCSFRNSVLHSEEGPAVTWHDGVKSWFLNGTNVPKWLVERDAEDIDVEVALRNSNAGVRREIIRKLGIERVCKEMKATTIDTKGDYELLLLDLGPEERPFTGIGIHVVDSGMVPHDVEADSAECSPWVIRRRPYLKMKNPSTGTYHIEGVPPSCRTVNDALKWRNGTEEWPIVLR